MTDITRSIIAINPNTSFTVDGDSVDKITWYDGNPTNITSAQILAKQVELKADYDAKQYQRDRTRPPQSGGYPPIEDQLDMLWHDKKDGTTTWEDAVQAIKDAHSKP